MSMTVTGSITYVELEGGFWGLETEGGEQYALDRLPPIYQREGLKVKAEIEPFEGFSMRMWGTEVTVKRVEAA